MHYTTIAVFRMDPATFRKLKDGLSKKRKYYFPREYLKTIADLESIHVSNKTELVQKLRQYTQDEINADERGIYSISTEAFKDSLVVSLTQKLKKPFSRFDLNGETEEGKFDSWNAFDVTTVKDLLDNLDAMNRFPHVIFTPDCEWVEAPEYFIRVDISSPRYQSYLDWENKVKKLLEQYSEDSIALLIDCHN